LYKLSRLKKKLKQERDVTVAQNTATVGLRV